MLVSTNNLRNETDLRLTWD